MATGLARLEGGTDQLMVASSKVADGAAAFAGGTAQAASGARRLADGVEAAADGARLVGAEVDALRDSGSDLTERATDLQGDLASGATGMPRYSDDERDTIGRLVANPVDVVTDRINAVTSEASTLAPYFMALAAWIGALAIFLIVPAVGGRSGDRRIGGLGAVAAATAIGIVQFALMVAVVALVLGVSIARPVELIAFGVVATIAFVAICQAFVAVLGARGWLLALGFVAIQLVAAGGAWPVQTAPGPLQAIHPLLPMTHAVEGTRALVAGGEAVGPALLVLLLWLAGALAVTVIAGHRRRWQGQRATFAAMS
jgi:putative membrane protein